MNDVDGLDAAAQGNTLYPSWSDENGSNPITDTTVFNSTSDGGATWQHATALEVQLELKLNYAGVGVAGPGPFIFSDTASITLWSRIAPQDRKNRRNSFPTAATAGVAAATATGQQFAFLRQARCPRHRRRSRRSTRGHRGRRDADASSLRAREHALGKSAFDVATAYDPTP